MRDIKERIIREWDSVLNLVVLVFAVLTYFGSKNLWWTAALWVALYVAITVGRVAGRKDMLKERENG